ncbi:MAG: hypothetical protein ACR2K0_02045 [Acidimicrobiales bacterium]
MRRSRVTARLLLSEPTKVVVIDAREIIVQLQTDPALRDLLRAVLLTEELLQLPSVVQLQGENLARLTDRVDQLAARTDQLAVRMDQLAASVEQMAAGVDRLAAGVDRVAVSVDQMAARIDQMAARVDQMAARVDQLAVLVGRLVDRSEEHLAVLADHGRALDELGVTLARIEERLG